MHSHAQLLRLRQIIGDPKADPPIPAIIPVSKSAFYAGIKSKKYPAPSHALGRVSVWRLEDIRRIVDAAAPPANEQEG
jgi:prophage regulatory protein